MRRMSIEPSPVSPELLAFTPDEASLSIRAISYYVATGLQTLEANWDSQGLSATGESVKGAMEKIDRTAKFVAFWQDLAAKVSVSVERPDMPVELSTDEIMRLGDALFCLGNSGITHARKALQGSRVGFSSEADRTIVAGKVEETGRDTFNLFAELEPIAKSKEGWAWMVWEAPLALPRPGRS